MEDYQMKISEKGYTLYYHKGQRIAKANVPSDVLPYLKAPSNMPSQQPSYAPSNAPSNMPSQQPSNMPSQQPSNVPLQQPLNVPLQQPSNMPFQINESYDVVHESVTEDEEIIQCGTYKKIIHWANPDGLRLYKLEYSYKNQIIKERDVPFEIKHKFNGAIYVSP